jgi:hypothetical protein
MTFSSRIDDGDIAGQLDAGEAADTAVEGAVDDAMFDLGGDERRMHVRAYNHWVSMLKGRPYPAIGDLDPSSIVDFGPHSVLLDFSRGIEDPGIAFLGRALREECELDADVTRVAQVPSRSLLSRLTDHYLQIIANRAPIGFEAEFIGTRGRTTLYRGILMPFSSEGSEIDFIYGVINWKEVADVVTQASLDVELQAAVRHPAPQTSTAPIWADGPSGEGDGAPADAAEALSGSLGDRLMIARESAAALRAADTRSRSALYRTLGRAHDFALAADEDRAGYDALLGQAGLVQQDRAPLTPVVKLVFGADYDKTRLAEYATVLHHARRHGVGAGALVPFLDAHEGGIKAVVAAERAERRPAKPDPLAAALEALRTRDALATVDLSAESEFVVLVARRTPDGRLDVVATTDHQPTLQAVIRRAA